MPSALSPAVPVPVHSYVPAAPDRDIVPSEPDISPAAELAVTNEMIRRGTDPAEARAFTRELYRVFREERGGRHRIGQK
jgi:hypothetical protein